MKSEFQNAESFNLVCEVVTGGRFQVIRVSGFLRYWVFGCFVICAAIDHAPMPAFDCDRPDFL